MEKSRRRKDGETSSLEEHSWPPQLTMDLTMEIFSRLSLKSIAISRCVSKQWASLLSHSDFRDLRLKRSKARPRLLFACIQDNNVFFLSLPQPQSLEEISSTSPVAAADYHMSFSFDHPVEDVSTSFSGFVCVRISGHRFVNGRKFMVDESVICNPSNGQSLTIPRMKTRKRTGMVRFFGYDPVEKLHKVLGMIRHNITMDHQVLTLGGGGGTAATWRMTELGGIPCDSSACRQHLCINGVFYYIDLVSHGNRIIVCFDVRSDKFSFVKFPERKLYPVVRLDYPGLLDFNGQLALVVSDHFYVSSEYIEMWVLQDPERHEWSKLVYVFPPMWKAVVDPGERLEIVGVTGPDEFVMSPTCSSDPFLLQFRKGNCSKSCNPRNGSVWEWEKV